MNIIKLIDSTIKKKIQYWFKDKDIVVYHKPTVYRSSIKCKDKCTYDEEANINKSDIKVYICRTCLHSKHIYKNRASKRKYETITNW